MGDILLVSTVDLKEHHLGNGFLHEESPEEICQAEIYAFNKKRSVPRL